MTTTSTDHQLPTFNIDTFADERGQLSVLDLLRRPSLVPFEVQRVFWITEVPEGQMRGTHAHRTCWEALVVLHGACTLKAENLQGECFEQRLESSSQGVVVPPLVWAELCDFTPGCVLLCLASEPYKPEGYLKDYEDFRSYGQTHLVQS